jgi:hypothetical protein
MADELKINKPTLVKEVIEVQDPVIELEETVIEFIDTVPSNWVIKPTDVDGIIEARNSLSGETYEGSVADFNIALRA